jgi:hypothetical protein
MSRKSARVQVLLEFWPIPFLPGVRINLSLPEMAWKRNDHGGVLIEFVVHRARRKSLLAKCLKAHELGFWNLAGFLQLVPPVDPCARRAPWIGFVESTNPITQLPYTTRFRAFSGLCEKKHEFDDWLIDSAQIGPYSTGTRHRFRCLR